MKKVLCRVVLLIALVFTAASAAAQSGVITGSLQKTFRLSEMGVDYDTDGDIPKESIEAFGFTPLPCARIDYVYGGPESNYITIDIDGYAEQSFSNVKFEVAHSDSCTIYLVRDAAGDNVFGVFRNKGCGWVALVYNLSLLKPWRK